MVRRKKNVWISILLTLFVVVCLLPTQPAEALTLKDKWYATLGLRVTFINMTDADLYVDEPGFSYSFPPYKLWKEKRHVYPGEQIELNYVTQQNEGGFTRIRLLQRSTAFRIWIWTDGFMSGSGYYWDDAGSRSDEIWNRSGKIYPSQNLSARYDSALFRMQHKNEKDVLAGYVITRAQTEKDRGNVVYIISKPDPTWINPEDRP